MAGSAGPRWSGADAGAGVRCRFVQKPDLSMPHRHANASTHTTATVTPGVSVRSRGPAEKL